MQSGSCLCLNLPCLALTVWHFLYVITNLFVFLVNKQINDKERVAAAMENPNLKKIVEDCLKEPD
jgi:hypothetical protein